MEKKEINKHVSEMYLAAKLLVPFSFPKVDFSQEQEVILLKQRNIVVDSYEITICYSKADYDEYFLESLQIQSYYTPFLPFVLVCKFGRIFLGQENLGYLDFFRNGKKVYCWAIRSNDGKSIPQNKKTKLRSYEGFKFSIIENKTIDVV